MKDLDWKEGKLGRQAWRGFMVGYLGAQGYRVYNPERKSVYLVRDVVFKEGTPRRTQQVETESAVVEEAFEGELVGQVPVAEVEECPQSPVHVPETP